MIQVDKKLLRISPLKMWFHFSLTWMLLLGSVYGAVSGEQLWFQAFCFFIIGSQMYGLQILLHDGMHTRLLESKRANDVLCKFFLAPFLFTNFEVFQIKHLRHHRNLGTPQDPDKHYYMRQNKRSKLKFLFFLTGLGPFIDTLLSYEKVQSKKGPVEWVDMGSKEEKRIYNFIWMPLYQLGIFLLFFTLSNPWNYLFFWVCPFGVGVFIFQSFRSFCEHAPILSDPSSSQLVTYKSVWIERFFFSPFNMNFHAEHHLHAGVPYYHLPAFQKHLKATGQFHTVEERGSYLAFGWKYLSRLPWSLPTQSLQSDFENRSTP